MAFHLKITTDSTKTLYIDIQHANNNCELNVHFGPNNSSFTSSNGGIKEEVIASNSKVHTLDLDETETSNPTFEINDPKCSNDNVLHADIGTQSLLLRTSKSDSALFHMKDSDCTKTSECTNDKVSNAEKNFHKIIGKQSLCLCISKSADTIFRNTNISGCTYNRSLHADINLKDNRKQSLCLRTTKSESAIFHIADSKNKKDSKCTYNKTLYIDIDLKAKEKQSLRFKNSEYTKHPENTNDKISNTKMRFHKRTEKQSLYLHSSESAIFHITDSKHNKNSEQTNNKTVDASISLKTEERQPFSLGSSKSMSAILHISDCDKKNSEQKNNKNLYAEENESSCFHSPKAESTLFDLKHSDCTKGSGRSNNKVVNAEIGKQSFCLLTSKSATTMFHITGFKDNEDSEHTNNKTLYANKDLKPEGRQSLSLGSSQPASAIFHISNYKNKKDTQCTTNKTLYANIDLKAKGKQSLLLRGSKSKNAIFETKNCEYTKNSKCTNEKSLNPEIAIHTKIWKRSLCIRNSKSESALFHITDSKSTKNSERINNKTLNTNRDFRARRENQSYPGSAKFNMKSSEFTKVSGRTNKMFYADIDLKAKQSLQTSNSESTIYDMKDSEYINSNSLFSITSHQSKRENASYFTSKIFETKTLNYSKNKNLCANVTIKAKKLVWLRSTKSLSSISEMKESTCMINNTLCDNLYKSKDIEVEKSSCSDSRKFNSTICESEDPENLKRSALYAVNEVEKNQGKKPLKCTNSETCTIFEKKNTVCVIPDCQTKDNKMSKGMSRLIRCDDLMSFLKCPIKRVVCQDNSNTIAKSVNELNTQKISSNVSVETQNTSNMSLLKLNL